MMNNDDGITNIPATGLKVEMQSGKSMSKSRNSWAENAI